jgi:hypothetical protein
MPFDGKLAWDIRNLLATLWKANAGYCGLQEPSVHFASIVAYFPHTSSQSEEPPSALLLAHAALLSAQKKARRRSSLLYFSAANRLEKCGIVRYDTVTAAIS